MRDRRAERRKATMDEIIEAAWALARQNGLAGLSLRDIAEQVGMKAPSLYSYFASKNAVYDAMYAQGAREFLERNVQFTMTGDPLPDLRAGMRGFIEFCTDDPVRYQLLFQRTIPGFEPSAESFAISIDGLEAVRSQLEQIGITDPRMLDLMTAVGTGLTDQQISNDPGGDRWSRLVDEAMEMFFNHAMDQTSKRGRKRS